MDIKRSFSRFVTAGAVGALAVASGATATGATAAEATAPTFTCHYGEWALPYAPTASLAQSGTGLTLSMSAFPAIAGVPSFVTVSQVVGTAVATVAGKSVSLAGTQVIDPATPMATGFQVPLLSGALPSGLPDGTLAIADLDFEVTAMGGVHDITCDVESPGSFDVSATAALKVASKTAASVKVSKKRVPTATVKVTGKAGKASGKVSLTLKQGKKVVQRKSLKLSKKGAATAKLRKLKKGRYALTVQYSGDKAYKGSKKTVTFRVK